MLETPEVLNPEPPGKEIAAAITWSAQLGEGLSVVVQTYVPRDAGPEMYNRVLDAITLAIDRKAAQYNLRGLKDKLEADEKSLALMTEDFRSIDTRVTANWQKSRKKGEPQMTASEEAAKKTAETNIRRWRDEIAKTKANIAKVEAEIAKAG